MFGGFLFWIVDVLMISTFLPWFCGVASRYANDSICLSYLNFCIVLCVIGLDFVLFVLPTYFVSLFVADHLWRYANHVFLWSASRDGSGIRCQDRMVLSSWSAHPHTRSLHSSAASLPSGWVARSSQPVLLLMWITTSEQFSCDVTYINFKILCAYNVLISSPLSTWTDQSVEGQLMKRVKSMWLRVQRVT